MKRSTLEPLLLFAGSICMFVVIFRQTLGLGENWQWPFIFASGACWLTLLLLQRRWKALRQANGTMPKPKQPKATFWTILSMLVLGTLSGPLWLPYTGTTLSFPASVLTSIISCIFAVGVFLVAWRRRSPKV
jgi:hypothetical protein